MACGVPVVATNAGAVSDTLIDADCGFIVDNYQNAEEAQASIKQLADRLVYLDTHRNRLMTMGWSARERIEHMYSWEKQAPKWENVLLGKS